MAEKVARNRQYEYRANSNLVLMAERTGSRLSEPTGEPETLWGRLRGQMGDKVKKTAPPIKQNLEKLKKRAKDNLKAETQILKKLERESVLSAKIDDTFYKPKTKETKIIYEKLLSELQNHLGDQPTSVLAGFADEILYLLKNENMREQEKKDRVCFFSLLLFLLYNNDE